MTATRFARTRKLAGFYEVTDGGRTWTIFNESGAWTVYEVTGAGDESLSKWRHAAETLRAAYSWVCTYGPTVI